jgi:hypothetical protein
MRKAMVILAAGMPCVLAGCDLPGLDQPVLAVAPTTYHTVAYYDTHPLERDQAKAWCDNNPAAYTGGLATKYPSCNSASISAIHAFDHKMGWQ